MTFRRCGNTLKNWEPWKLIIVNFNEDKMELHASLHYIEPRNMHPYASVYLHENLNWEREGLLSEMESDDEVSEDSEEETEEESEEEMPPLEDVKEEIIFEGMLWGYSRGYGSEKI